MSTVDEILVSGRYTDRRGRMWERKSSDGWWYHFPSSLRLTPPQMLLLIERDRHRDECKGIGFCLAHPVPNVIAHKPHLFEVFGARNSSTLHADRFACTLPDAMDAARALAVEP